MPSINRRTALGGGLASVAVLKLSPAKGARQVQPEFSLGVASGCPRPESIVLWTRLVFPETPADPFSFTPLEQQEYAPCEVEWTLARDAALTDVVQRGTTVASADFGHSVHVEIDRLTPATTYYYGFSCNGAASRIGRTKTAPTANAETRVRFAFASCQHFEQGFYAAYRDMAAREIDFVLHLGDYIYEGGSRSGKVRSHEAGIPTTLDEYRARYKTYKSDADLQAAHAAFPWLVIWDDHEVVDNYHSTSAPTATNEPHFLTRRQAAYQAWYEHMPVPPHLAPDFRNLRIHDHFAFGSMLDLLLLDARQYRSHVAANLAEAAQSQRTMFGSEQEKWLEERLSQAHAKWTLLAQPTLLSERIGGYGREKDILDGWDGYQVARRRLMTMIDKAALRNVVLLGGDLHSYYAAQIPETFDMPAAKPLATEFVVGSITSNGLSQAALDKALSANPRLRFGRGGAHGYALATLTQDRCIVEFVAVSDKNDPEATVEVFATFTIKDGISAIEISK
jgi:alkaline phosphatase D